MIIYFFGLSKRNLKYGYSKWLTNVVPHLKIETRFLFSNPLLWNKYALRLSKSLLFKVYFRKLERIVSDDLLHVVTHWGNCKQVAHHVGCKKIITIHDLYDPEGHSEPLVKELEPYLTDYEAIFVPSEETYRHLCINFPNLNLKTHIIPNCVDTCFFKPLEIEHDEVWRLMYVGTEKPSKNLPLLFKALARLKKIFGDHLEFVKVGRPSQGQRGNLVRLAKSLGIENSIRWIDWVPDRELVMLYNLADVYVQPSICEGFGMPVVEAMACGTAVIVNNSSSLPEVVGDAGLLFDNSVEDLVDALYLVLNDTRIKENLGKRGREKVLKLYTPDRVAKMMLSAYKEIGD